MVLPYIPLLSSSKRRQRLARLGFQMCRGVLRVASASGGRV